MRTPFLVMAISLFLACGGTPEGADARDPDGSSQESGSAEAPIDLSPWDVPLSVTPPARPGDSLQVSWNEEFGQLEVVSGEHFSLIITEGPGDVARLKADLERDLLRTHVVVQEEPGLVVYRSTFPDDPDLVFVQLYRVVQAGDRTFVIETHPQGRFNEADVEVMVQAVSPNQGA